MIFKDLQAQFCAAETVTREFATLMDATFTNYRNIAEHLFGSLPSHLQQSELLSLVNGELKARLFDQGLCESIPQALKNVRRAILRLEDLAALHPRLPKYVNDLGRLAAIAERVEALYQQHWEYYRYQPGLTDKDLVDFLLRVQRIGAEWDAYLEGFHDKAAMVEALHGRPTPEAMASLRVSYQRDGAAQFSVGTLKALVNFLESGYGFVCAIYGIEPEAEPLSLLHVEVGDPVELYLALPEQAESAYRRFLQYLFLKDMLKRESLLKFVFEAVEKEHGRAKALSQAQIATFQKDLAAQVKALPSDGRFTISDRTFPDDEVRVLQEFAVTLDNQQIDYDAMVRGERKKPTRSRSGAQESKVGTPQDKPQPANDLTRPSAAVPPPPAAHPAHGSALGTDSANPREHIRILTDSSLRS